MMLSLFEVAVATTNEVEAEHRGNWLSVRLDQSLDIDEELEERISNALDAYEEVAL
jgi:hypothetical protein